MILYYLAMNQYLMMVRFYLIDDIYYSITLHLSCHLQNKPGAIEIYLLIQFILFVVKNYVLLFL
ncbi:MAG: hypothetical protein CVV24_08120 [Ignavibacteriae bacterium HGW-Ignavibacteriae-3]|nr:MAG: hypothetical protein CVV24_08120 [Ignavibacteriae bacterium HGW-Ignavibacteriae-3]